MGPCFSGVDPGAISFSTALYDAGQLMALKPLLCRARASGLPASAALLPPCLPAWVCTSCLPAQPSRSRVSELQKKSFGFSGRPSEVKRFSVRNSLSQSLCLLSTFPRSQQTGDKQGRGPRDIPYNSSQSPWTFIAVVSFLSQPRLSTPSPFPTPCSPPNDNRPASPSAGPTAT